MLELVSTGGIVSVSVTTASDIEIERLEELALRIGGLWLNLLFLIDLEDLERIRKGDLDFGAGLALRRLDRDLVEERLVAVLDTEDLRL